MTRAFHATLLFALTGVVLAEPLGAASSGVLRYGDSGRSVAALQNDLRADGFDPGPTDGRFSPKTERSVASFQESAGLPVTGVVDAQTAAALGAAQSSSLAAAPAKAPEGLPPPPPGWIRGIDVSRYDVNVNWAAVASSKIAFGIARASNGLAVDPFFAQNWTGMQASGLLRGASQFFRASQDPIQQADLLIAEIGALGAGDFAPFLEVSTLDGATPAVAAAEVAAWIGEIEARTGAVPIVATSRALWQSIGNPSPGGSPLWVFDWGVTAPVLPQGWSSWTFWQYSSTGSVNGIYGNVDLDYFHGSCTAMNALASPPPAPAIPVANPAPPAAADALTDPAPAASLPNSPDPLAAFATNPFGQPPAAAPANQPPALSSGASPSSGSAATPAAVSPSNDADSTAPTGGQGPPSASGGPGPSPSSGAPASTVGIAPALDGGLHKSTGSSHATTSYNGQIPASLRPVLAKALAADGLPASWLDSNGLKQILQHESSFNPTAQNPTSTAYGLFQFLNSTWKGVGATKTSDPYLQSVAGLKYIQERYGNPDNAWTFWQAHHWY